MSVLSIARNRAQTSASNRRLAAVKATGPTKKLYVLDTCVHLVDPLAVYHFEEHDVFTPLCVVRQLDDFKKGDGELAYFAREATRNMEGMANVAYAQGDVSMSLAEPSEGKATGTVHFQLEVGNGGNLNAVNVNVDDQLLRITDLIARRFRKQYRDVILVTRDTNLRLRALMQGISAEDYQYDRVDDIDSIYHGVAHVAEIFEGMHNTEIKDGNILAHGPRVPYHCNQHVYDESGKKLYRVIDIGAHHVQLHPVPLRTEKSHAVAGILARKGNLEQSAALDVLLDESIRCLSLQGPLGTGKTLLALAAAIKLVQEGTYEQILYIRSVVPADQNEEIGFLPGTMDDKTAPWKAPIADSLHEIQKALEHAHDTRIVDVNAIIKEKLSFEPIVSIRGRTFHDSIIIIDEAQNLGRNTLKTVLGRTGESSKVILLSDVSQIDTPYLDAHSSGVTHFITKAQNVDFYASVTLVECERGRVAKFVSETL